MKKKKPKSGIDYGKPSSVSFGGWTAKPISILEFAKKVSKEDLNAPWLQEFIDEHSLRHNINLEEFDRKSAQGYKLNLLTGEYYK